MSTNTGCVENSPYKTKDPDSTIDFTVDWTTGPNGGWLAEGETIATSAWLLPDDPGGLAIATDTHTDTVATVWLTGGTLGAWVDVTNRITTNQGRTEDQTLHFEITEH